MFHGEEKVEDGNTNPRIGVSVEQAGEIGTNNAIYIGLGSVVMFYLIYRFLVK